MWFNAIQDGLLAADRRGTAEALVPGDVRVAFFGDLFRPPGTMAAAEPPYSVADVAPGLERDLLATFFETAVAQDPALGAPEGAMGGGRAAAQVMLDRLARSATFARAAQRGFIGNLKQVTAFLTNPVVKQKVLRKDLAPLFPRAAQGETVVDSLVDNGDQPHAIDRYLNTRQTGRALGGVLR
jgi:hypothetical protein